MIFCIFSNIFFFILNLLNFKSYNSNKDEKAVEYRDFCREVETAFGSDQYEKNPLLDPEQHVANNHIESNYLKPDENDMLIAAMERLAQRVNLFYNLLLFSI